VVTPFRTCGCRLGFDGSRTLMSSVVGEQVGAYLQVPKREFIGNRSPPLSCTNMIEVQVNLDGRIHSKPAPPVGRLLIAADLAIG
jgi:hypothetical protein